MKIEKNLLYSWVNSLPAEYAKEMTSLYEEMAERKTIEAQIYKAIDGIEALISAPGDGGNGGNGGQNGLYHENRRLAKNL